MQVYERDFIYKTIPSLTNAIEELTKELKRYNDNSKTKSEVKTIKLFVNGTDYEVRLENPKVYGQRDYHSYTFGDGYIYKKENDEGEDGYLLFFFEVDDGVAHYFVEEGFKDGSAETHRIELEEEDRERIREFYNKYMLHF